ncbi:stealth family protein [Faecalicatena faecalis]|nr:stealth family protein [Faecalicatena faecalis]
MNNIDIDIVVLWVDGNDPLWQKEKEQYSQKRDSSKDSARYRDWNILPYWFRGVETFLPWIRKIHFVTWGHLPRWLNVNHPKLHIVNHKDFIPKEYLPTFNSPTIEMNIHRIDGLSEHFIYFNDDMFVLKPMSKEDFFVEGHPCETAIMNAISCVPGWENESYIQFNNAGIINKHFNKKKVIRNNVSKWLSLKYGKQLYRNIILSSWPYFTGFYTNHLPTSMKKDTFEQIWDNEFPLLNKMCKHKFRSPDMVNQWLIAEWQMCQGDFVPRSPGIGKTFSISENPIGNRQIFDAISNQEYNLICINDYIYDDGLFDNLQIELEKSFQKILANKSSYEI